MITLDITVEQSLLTKRGHNKMMREILRESLEEHRDERLPRHFERNQDTAPGGAYGYSPRTRVYMIRKARKVGHQIPLVLSGRLRQVIKANVKITATSNRARLKTRGYFPMKTELRREIEVISPAEKSAMRGMVGLKYSAYAKRPEFQEYRRTRKRG